jgi:hypothetical protein
VSIDTILERLQHSNIVNIWKTIVVDDDSDSDELVDDDSESDELVHDVVTDAYVYTLPTHTQLFSIVSENIFDIQSLNFFCRDMRLCSAATQDPLKHAMWTHTFSTRYQLRLLSVDNHWRHEIFGRGRQIPFKDLEDSLYEYCQHNHLDGWYLKCELDNKSFKLEDALHEVVILREAMHKVEHINVSRNIRQ